MGGTYIAYDDEKGGRPPVYDETDHPERAYDLIVSCGANYLKIAKHFHVHHTQISRWYAQHEEFRTKVREAQALWWGQNLRIPLFKLCMGFTTTETYREVNANTGKITITKKVTKRFPPNFPALKFAMENLEPETFQDRQTIEHKGNITVQTVDYAKAKKEDS